MAKFSRLFFFLPLFIFFSQRTFAQVNGVTFGKNRIQYKKTNWQYYQSDRFNVYFYEQGKELAKFVLQVAEKELTQIESAAEFSIQRRVNIIVYNSEADFKQSNIGLENDIVNTGTTTQLVNNKMLVYFDTHHDHLKTQIRQGIADVITKNILFGEDLSEVATNQTLLDLPKWFTDGYIAYLGEHWNTTLDDQLKNEILSGKYSKFSSFSMKNPALAGHAFWYFIEEKYKKENVTYFLYLARTYKSVNKASLQIANKKFKALTAEFMEATEEKYNSDIARRRNVSKGTKIDNFYTQSRLNYYRFNVNPNKKNNTYLVTQYKKGIVRVLLNEDGENKTLIKFGTRTLERSNTPQYPIIAWDPKGTKVSIIYTLKGKLKLMVYDVARHWEQYDIDLTHKFDQVEDFNYMIDSRTLVLSAVKNGHTDIFTFDIEKEKSTQLTNDVYDDLEPSFVTFPNKMGIVFSSNRPNPSAIDADTALPSNNRYNIFMIPNYGDKTEANQITQLTKMNYGNANYPAQYNINHFSFLSDENGILNRYAGMFVTKKAGLDTLITIGSDMLRNPTQHDIDSALASNNVKEITAMNVVSISTDSSYVFPITNIPYNIVETRTAGSDRVTSEVTQSTDEKIVTKIKADEGLLTQRSIVTPPTTFAKKIMLETNMTPSLDSGNNKKEAVEELQSEFPSDSLNVGNVVQSNPIYDPNSDVLSRAKLFRYKPIKFTANTGSANFNTTVLFNKYQPYGGGSGPIMLSSNTPLNGLITMSTSDLLEDKRITGGFKIGTNLKDNEWLVSFQNLKRKIDWGATYYRNAIGTGATIQDLQGNILATYPAKMFTNIYQGNISYPFDETKSVRLTLAVRSDNIAISNVDQFSAALSNQQTYYSVAHAEYVYDNSLNRAINILHGMRYKVFMDYNRQLGKIEDPATKRAFTFNTGFDGRYYYPIYQNFIWAGRIAGDFSWGNQKFIYYLGGVDGWLMFGNNTKPGSTKERYFNSSNTPAADNNYAFQSLAVNMRGYIQNASNGNNAIVLNSEFRMPVLSTLFDKTVSNPFFRDLQLTQFIDLGTAWNGNYKNIKRPETTYTQGPVSIKVKNNGVGPFLGGYGFGARSTLFGYFVKYDVGWPMTGFFFGKPVMYVSLGLDF
jgi:hypothetical protein